MGFFLFIGAVLLLLVIIGNIQTKISEKRTSDEIRRKWYNPKMREITYKTAAEKDAEGDHKMADWLRRYADKTYGKETKHEETK